MGRKKGEGYKGKENKEKVKSKDKGKRKGKEEETEQNCCLNIEVSHPAQSPE